MAQLGSVLPWGGRGRRFKSCRSDIFLCFSSNKEKHQNFVSIKIWAKNCTIQANSFDIRATIIIMETNFFTETILFVIAGIIISILLLVFIFCSIGNRNIMYVMKYILRLASVDMICHVAFCLIWLDKKLLKGI